MEWRRGDARMVAEESKTRATDFSIAAIMARSAAEPRSPAPAVNAHHNHIHGIRNFISRRIYSILYIKITYILRHYFFNKCLATIK